jgi:hypothetical protein
MAAEDGFNITVDGQGHITLLYIDFFSDNSPQRVINMHSMLSQFKEKAHFTVDETPILLSMMSQFEEIVTLLSTSCLRLSLALSHMSFPFHSFCGSCVTPLSLPSHFNITTVPPL